MRAEHFMYFCIKNYIGTRVEDFPTVKVLYTHRKFNTTSLSKAVILV